MAFIYKITNKVNGKVYIGKTEESIEKRFKQHLSESQKERCKNRPLYKAMLKYGRENFEVSLIEETDKPTDREIFWIDFYKSYSKGYNATKGGDGASYLDEQVILKKLLELNLNCHKTSICLEVDHKTVLKIAKKHKLFKKSNGGKTVKVVCIETGEVFEKVQDASAYLVNLLNKDCDPAMYGTHISSICRNKRKSLFGYSFKYV